VVATWSSHVIHARAADRLPSIIGEGRRSLGIRSAPVAIAAIVESALRL
jgi:hypothetical protein